MSKPPFKHEGKALKRAGRNLGCLSSNLMLERLSDDALLLSTKRQLPDLAAKDDNHRLHERARIFNSFLSSSAVGISETLDFS